MSNYLDNLAEQTYSELNSPSGISSAYIKQFFLTNIGGLNNHLNLSYSGVTGTILPEISGDAQFIFKEMFFVHYLDREIKNNLGAAGYDFEIIKEGNREIRRPSKTELAKTYQLLKREVQDKLTFYINCFRHNKAIPVSIDAGSTSLISSLPLSYVELK